MAPNEPLSQDRFEAILAAYGAAPRRWPEAERDQALALLERSAAARALLEEAAALDGLLDAAPEPSPSPELMAEVLAAGSRSRWRRLALRLWPYGPIWRPAVALASAAVLGLFVGFAQLPSGGDDLSSLTADIDNAMFGGDSQGLF